MLNNLKSDPSTYALTLKRFDKIDDSYLTFYDVLKKKLSKYILIFFLYFVSSGRVEYFPQNTRLFKTPKKTTGQPKAPGLVKRCTTKGGKGNVKLSSYSYVNVLTALGWLSG